MCPLQNTVCLIPVNVYSVRHTCPTDTCLVSDVCPVCLSPVCTVSIQCIICLSLSHFYPVYILTTVCTALKVCPTLDVCPIPALLLQSAPHLFHMNLQSATHLSHIHLQSATHLSHIHLQSTTHLPHMTSSLLHTCPTCLVCATHLSCIHCLQSAPQSCARTLLVLAVCPSHATAVWLTLWRALLCSVSKWCSGVHIATVSRQLSGHAREVCTVSCAILRKETVILIYSMNDRVSSQLFSLGIGKYYVLCHALRFHFFF